MMEPLKFAPNLRRPRYELDVNHFLSYLTVSNDSQFIAVGGGERITVLDANTHDTVWTKDFPDGMKFCRFTPDCSYFIYGQKEMFFVEPGNWDEPKFSFKLGAKVSSATISTTGDKVWVGTYDNCLHYFELGDKGWAHIQKHELATRAKDLTADPLGRYLVAATKEGAGMAMYDAARLAGAAPEGALRPVIDSDLEPEVGCVGFSPNGKKLVWGGSLTVLMMEVDKPTDIEPLPVDPLRRKTRCLAFSADSRWVMYGGASRDVTVVDTETLQPLFRVGGFHEGVWNVAFAPGNAWLLACSYSRQVTVAQLANTAPPLGAALGAAAPGRGAAVARRGGRLAGPADGAGRALSVRDFDPAGGLVEVARIERPELKKAKGQCCAISRDGALVVWSAPAGNAVYRLGDGGAEKVCEFDHDLGPHGIGIDDAGEFLLTDDQNEVHVTDAATGAVVLTRALPLEVFAAAFAPLPAAEGGEGGPTERLFAVGYGSQVEVYAAPPGPAGWRGGEPEVRMRGSTGDNVNCLAFSLDCRLVAASSEGFQVMVWEVATGLVVGVYKHDDTVCKVQFSSVRPEALLTVTESGNVALFDTAAGARAWLKAAGPRCVDATLTVMGAGGGEGADAREYPGERPGEYGERVAVVYQGHVEYHSVQLALGLGPTASDFVGAVHLDTAYTRAVARRTPFLCCVVPADLPAGAGRAYSRAGTLEGDNGAAPPLAGAGGGAGRAKPGKGGGGMAGGPLEQLRALAASWHEASSAPGGGAPEVAGAWEAKTAAQRAVELDAGEALTAMLEACPGAAVACQGLPIQEALTMGNKGMLRQVLMAGSDPALSYSAREIITEYLEEIATKAPTVLADVLGSVGMQEYQLEGYKYCACDSTQVVHSENWGAGEIWRAFKVKEGEEEGVEDISKVTLARVLFPRMASPDVLAAIVEANVLELFSNTTMQNVIDTMWEYYYRKRFVMVFSLHFSMFVANFLSAVFSVYARRDGAGTIDTVLDVFLLILGGYNILYEVYQATTDFSPDFWNLLDWTYYVLLVVNSVFSLLDRAIWELGAVNVVLSCMEMLFYMRGFTYTGFLVRMVVQVFSDLKPFMMVVVVIISAFAGSFYTMNTGDTYTGYDGYAGYIVWTFLLMNQIVWDSNFWEDSVSPVLNHVLVCLFLFVTAIIMLNFIIAILGDTYSSVSQNARSEGMRERANIMLELNFYLTAKEREKVEQKFRWIHVMTPWDIDSSSAAQDSGEGGARGSSAVAVLENKVRILEGRIAAQAAEIRESNELLAKFYADFEAEELAARDAHGGAGGGGRRGFLGALAGGGAPGKEEEEEVDTTKLRNLFREKRK